jgi:sugar diacid utilization regulator
MEIKNKADSEYATYWWDIHFNSTQKATKMRGYSKFIGQPENTCKHAVLRRVVRMFSNHNYLERVNYIEVHMREASIVQLDKDAVVLTLYPDSWEWADVTSEIAQTNNKYVKDVYAIRAGDKTVKLQPLPRSENSKDNLLDATKRNKYFRSLDHLQEECIKLTKSGLPSGHVTQFFKRCLELNPKLSQ